MHLVPFCGQDYKKQKWPGTSYQSPSGLQNMFRNIFYWSVTWTILMIQYKVVSELFQKLRLPIYASQFMLIIPVLSDPFNLETAKEGKITKRWISLEGKEFLDEIKTIYHNFWKCCNLVKYKKIKEASLSKNERGQKEENLLQCINLYIPAWLVKNK